MVGRADQHDLDIVSFEDFAIVGVDLATALESLIGCELLAVISIDVGAGNHVAESRGAASVADPMPPTPIEAMFGRSFLSSALA
jgi:hypothetical protein